MSYRVLVIPEDPTYNGHILQPLVKALLDRAGKSNSRVTVLTDPHIFGVDQAISSAPQIAHDSPMYDLFLLMVDRDARLGNGESRLQRPREAERRAIDDYGRLLLACAAIEEVEVWLMAGHPDKVEGLGFNWKDIRQHDNPKEQYFEPFLAAYGNRLEAGQGRKRLMREGLENLSGLLSRCDELADLLRRIEEAVANH
jgi:hypothetical protein